MRYVCRLKCCNAEEDDLSCCEREKQINSIEGFCKGCLCKRVSSGKKSCADHSSEDDETGAVENGLAAVVSEPVEREPLVGHVIVAAQPEYYWNFREDQSQSLVNNEERRYMKMVS
ncbi:unnamed protein product [Amoebophrya sp. A25]|nr:unnamed protein product [Amoebophrya sp. A25]|eukprot:GSA25T00004806001.1